MSNEFIVRYLGDSRTQTVGELIRCKDCKHWNPNTELAECDDYGESRPCSVMYARPMYEDDYCRYGERKEQME